MSTYTATELKNKILEHMKKENVETLVAEIVMNGLGERLEKGTWEFPVENVDFDDECDQENDMTIHNFDDFFDQLICDTDIAHGFGISGSFIERCDEHYWKEES